MPIRAHIDGPDGIVQSPSGREVHSTILVIGVKNRDEGIFVIVVDLPPVTSLLLLLLPYIPYLLSSVVVLFIDDPQDGREVSAQQR